MLPRSLAEIGKHGKIFGPKDLFSSCFELSGGINGLPTSHSSKDLHTPSRSEFTVAQRKAMSLAHPPMIITSTFESRDDKDSVKDQKYFSVK